MNKIENIVVQNPQKNVSNIEFDLDKRKTFLMMNIVKVRQNKHKKLAHRKFCRKKEML